MNILLTGASSFTGYWFAKALSDSGHQVVAPLRASATAYADGVRAERVRRLARVAEIVDEAPFGSGKFLSIARGPFDVLCHHAARVADYRSLDFDVAGALAENTANLRSAFEILARGGLKTVVLTGSVFEQNEGAGEAPLVAFSAYGLSKGLTAEVVTHRCREFGLRYSKFVIPNPFGPLEEPRFCAYLNRCWKNGEVASVSTPNYVRDNIHVALLARAYTKFVGEAVAGKGRDKINPSGYVETQGAFAERFAAAMRPRLGMECAIELAKQTDFSEPLIRVNTDSAAYYVGNWDEDAAWEEAANEYRN